MRTLRHWTAWTVVTLAMVGCGETPSVSRGTRGSSGESGGAGNTGTGPTNTDVISSGGGTSTTTAPVGGGGGTEGPVCGDGTVEGAEVCDDGNTRPSDGCNGACTRIETGYACPPAGGACESTIECGNGDVEPGEGCDDGPSPAAGDGCDAECQVELGWSCPNDGTPCVRTDTPAECGNGTRETGETCDDGQKPPVSNDGCSSTCQAEAGDWNCVDGSLCDWIESCGDGTVNQASEQCDDGNTDVSDGCNARCQVLAGWQCPPTGGACVNTYVCGDGDLDPYETCDDGQTTPQDNDGCSSKCRVETGWSCETSAPAASVCSQVPQASCGDGTLDLGEWCDDGNVVASPVDGCDASCNVDLGYQCSGAGAGSCSVLQICGNGTLEAGEECEDDDYLLLTGPEGGDGCSADCRVEALFVCPTVKEACTSLVRCGDGKIQGAETCDDGQATPTNGDGCSAVCAREDYFTCPVAGAACQPVCGDGKVYGRETCDDGQATPTSGDGCSASCQIETDTVLDGNGWPSYWTCPTENHVGGGCLRAECGNGTREGAEACDGNLDRDGDGKVERCSKNCTWEPKCPDAGGPCTSACGDGLIINEACDDGNAVSGDGCSSTCTIEDGYTCTATLTLPDTLRLPTVYRDFNAYDDNAGLSGHPDFQFGSRTCTVTSGTNDTLAITGLMDGTTALGMKSFRVARVTLGGASPSDGAELIGEPIFNYATCPLPRTATGADYDCNNTQFCIPTVQSATSYQQWYRDVEGVNQRLDRPLLLRRIASGAYQFNSDCADGDPNALCYVSGCTGKNPPAACSLPRLTTSPGFFPVDTFGTTGTACAEYGSVAHNFHFTTETRYWFKYDAGKSATLSFSGDDDVWVYIDRKMVVDLGGMHGPTGKSVTVNTLTTDVTGSPLALLDGKVYEIVVFQAERNICGSNYKLTLDGFATGRSVCTPDCGDGVQTPDEACDLGDCAVGENGLTCNSGAYNACTSGCNLAAYCGNGTVDAAGNEICDEPSATRSYGWNALAGTAYCTAQCTRAPYCGDEEIYGSEACDRGSLNVAAAATSLEAYGKCTNSCELGPRCGDGKVFDGIAGPASTESCDAGVLNGTPSSDCDSSCQLKCGNGQLDAGEQCDLGTAQNTGDYGGCTSSCKLAERCGDGIQQLTEACDDGANDGTYGTCGANCALPPRCGDGTVQSEGGEACDAGGANSGATYATGSGVCTTACRVAGYCGDGILNGTEVCDSGSSAGQAGSCNLTCTAWVPPPVTCGNSRLDSGEECDEGSTGGTTCDARCHLKCGNGIVDGLETCDDGLNDGTYGGCTPLCTEAGHCGDGVQDAAEQCDKGAGNQANPYGLNLCTTGCRTAPRCGDGRIQTSFGEACDGQAGCTASCRWNSSTD